MAFLLRAFFVFSLIFAYCANAAFFQPGKTLNDQHYADHQRPVRA